MLLKLFGPDVQLLAPLILNQGLDTPIGGIVRLQIVMLFADNSCADTIVNANPHPSARIVERRAHKRICCSGLLIGCPCPNGKPDRKDYTIFPGWLQEGMTRGEPGRL